MKKVLYIVVAMVAALSSCSSNEDITESNGNDSPMEFTATIVRETGSVGSRSTLGTDSHPNWEATDKVNINGAIFAVIPNPTDPTKADLKFSSGALSLSAPYKALFAGGDTQADDWDGTKFNFKLPATYTYSPGKFNMPMYAESNTKALNFYNICAVLAVKVTSAGLATVKTITVTSDNVICGSCTISGDGTTTKYTAVSSSTADKDKTVTINCGDGVTTTPDGIVFYLPLLTGSHTLSVTVSDGTTTKSWSATNSATIERSKIYGLSFGEYEYVDLGLSVLWATCNVGASKPEDIGNYYAWGETTPQSSNSYSWESYKWIQEGYSGDYMGYGCTKYTYADKLYDACWYSGTTYVGTTIDGVTYKNLKKLEDADDAATANFGSTWCMPTHAQWQELADKCTWEWDYEKKGYLVTSNKTGYTDKSIFLPATGYYDDGDLSYSTKGYYWSSELYPGDVDAGVGSDYAWHIEFGLGSSINADEYDYRCYGQSVRPVKKKQVVDLDLNSIGVGVWTESGFKTVYMNGYAVRIAGTTSDLCFNMSQSGNTLTIIAVPTSSTASGRTPTISPSSAGSSTLSGNICTTTLNNITTDVTVTY